MTTAECNALIPALQAATGYRWDVCVCGNGRLLVWPMHTRDRRGQLVLVESWCQEDYRGPRLHIRRVALRSKFQEREGLRRDIAPGRGWPARAAAAVVEMLGERERDYGEGARRRVRE